MCYDNILNIRYRMDFSGYSDRKLVEMVINDNNEEAICYLVYNRYLKDMVYLCAKYYGSDNLIHDLLGFLVLKLKGADGEWRPLRHFGWRSSFRTWLSTVASNLFLEKRKELLGLENLSVSIDVDEELKGKVQIPDSAHNYDKSPNVVILMEAISRLRNPLQKFVMVRELEGYSPKEIAETLNKLRTVEGSVAYGMQIDVTPAYVYNVKHRAIDNLKEIVERIKKEWYGNK